MQEVELKELLQNYRIKLCNKTFVFMLSGEKEFKIRFFEESACHLMGLQHVFDNSKHYLGARGCQKIDDGLITVGKLKSHNKKGYNFIKERLEHFNEILDILENGDLFKFEPEKVNGGSLIKAEFMINKNNEAYILHLFLVKERNTDVYTPLSFITQSSNDVDFNKYLKYQKHIKIVERKIIEAVS